MRNAFKALENDSIFGASKLSARGDALAGMFSFGLPSDQSSSRSERLKALPVPLFFASNRTRKGLGLVSSFHCRPAAHFAIKGKVKKHSIAACKNVHGHQFLVTQVPESTKQPFGNLCAPRLVSNANVVGARQARLGRFPYLGRVCSSGGSNFRHFAGGGVEEDYENNV